MGRSRKTNAFMIQTEKDSLLALFDDARKWCQGNDAMDSRGQSVHFDAAEAVSWDLVGGLCHLFGWARANTLFASLSLHIAGRRHLSTPRKTREMAAMSALMDFNDAEGTTYDVLINRLRKLPVWQGRRAPKAESGEVVEESGAPLALPDLPAAAHMDSEHIPL